MDETAAAKLKTWHLHQFDALGYTPEQALELHRAGADIHAHADLIGKGCPPLLAARILAPLP